MNSPIQILNQYKIKPRKKLGQSFLIDMNIIKSIVNKADINKTDIVVEIGSGIGILTEYLAQKAEKVIAVELDKTLVLVLQQRLKDYVNIEINHGNILNLNFKEIADRECKKIKIIGNIPYNITNLLLFRLLYYKNNINYFTLMMQEEVVERLLSKPGKKEYGVTSVIMQMFSYMERVMDVKSSSFLPRPKVESSVIRGFFRKEYMVDLNNEELFKQIVRLSFSQRRKMVINNLKRFKLFENTSEIELKKHLIFRD